MGQNIFTLPLFFKQEEYLLFYVRFISAKYIYKHMSDLKVNNKLLGLQDQVLIIRFP